MSEPKKYIEFSLQASLLRDGAILDPLMFHGKSPNHILQGTVAVLPDFVEADPSVMRQIISDLCLRLELELQAAYCGVEEE
jgi:hypothetical protein